MKNLKTICLGCLTLPTLAKLESCAEGALTLLSGEEDDDGSSSDMEVVYFARPDGVPNRLVAYRRQHRLRHAETYDSSRGGALDDVVQPLFFRPATVLLLTALPVGPGRANMMRFSSAGTQPATAVGWSSECL